MEEILEINRNFEDFHLFAWMVKQCANIGVKAPTPVQANCIPEILQGKNCIGAAKTGSGKTLAFALPMIQKLCEDPYGIFGLVLTPTRELAYQIADQFALVGKGMELRHCVIVGGMDWIEQGRQLAKKPHILISTPGRLADHLESCPTFSLKRIKFLVLDEADQLLSGGFEEQIQTIFQALPKKKQTLIFSATITDALKSESIRKVMKDSGNELFVYEAPAEVATVDQLDQQYVLCANYVKDAYLIQVLRKFKETNPQSSIIVFINTCKKCQVLCMTLNEIGFPNVALHGRLKQKERLGALTKFKSSAVKILLATDVAARGLDIPTVDLVINHSLPKVTREYVHRVGRTARIGRKGSALTLVAPHDVPLLLEVEKFINFKMSEFQVDDGEVQKIYLEVAVTKSESYLKLDEGDFDEKKEINRKKKLILKGLDPSEEDRKSVKRRKMIVKRKIKK